jgi:hypothetical protein
MAYRKPKIGLQILLLAAFAYWATGVAQYVHERLEHGFGVAKTTTLHDSTARPVQGNSGGNPPSHEPDDHDDCLTCQSLKIMKAAPVAAPVLAPQPTLLRHESPPILEREAPVLSFVVFIPSRAPPASSPAIAA